MKYIILLFLLVLIFPVSACGMGRAKLSYLSEVKEEITDGEYESTGSFDVLTEELLYVAVTGCVNKPGVYILHSGARVYEAINAAGGVSEDGNLSSVNLVAKVEDGTTINIKKNVSEENAEIAEEQSSDDGLIDINSASLNELMSINGIGKTRANAIISYREKNGPFNSIEDIMNVNGIKEGTFESVKDYIKVR